MVVICEECGKIYKLDAEKLKKSMKGKTSKITCKVCDHVIEVGLPDENSEESIQGNVQQVAIDNPAPEQQIIESSDESDDHEVEEESIPENEPPVQKTKQKKKDTQKKKSGAGLRTKMFFLFLVIPITLMAASWPSKSDAAVTIRKGLSVLSVESISF